MKPKKLILSRKGFDSGSGGCPSPIFPDGTMFSLPIPSGDEEAFEDLQHGDVDIASVVSGITNGRMNRRGRVHLDPDLNFDAYRYRKDRPDWQQWRGMLGQPGNSKERTFESTFVLALRQPRRRSSSPARTRTDSERKTPKVQNDGTTAVQKTLPIPGVAEREAASPQQTKPIAIRPRRHARRRVNKNLQRSFLESPPESK